MREFTLIVAGVLAALASQSWWEDRQDRALERRYLGSLAADLRADLAEFDHAIHRNELNDHHGRTVLRALQPVPGAIAPDSLAYAIERAGYMYLAVISSHTFDELRSTGGLQLLRDFPLKRQIAEYYRFIQSSNQWDEGYQQERLLYRQKTKGILVTDARLRARTGRPLALPASETDRMVRLLRAQPELPNQVQELIYIRGRKRQDYRSMADRARTLLSRLEEGSVTPRQGS